MTNSNFTLTLTKQITDLCQQSEGFTLSETQIRDIASGSDTAPRVFNGCIKALSYVDNSGTQLLQQIILDTSDGRIIFTCRDDIRQSKKIIKVKNLSVFEKTLKNAADFGHQPCFIVEDYQIIWFTLLPFRCLPEGINTAIAAFTQPGDSDHSPD